ncbi:hypothetical protein EAO68_02390 [Streptomyces sp. wa22]|nr:hypothetical protein EAO68_02390 [Streptomyces sp. wa22]
MLGARREDTREWILADTEASGYEPHQLLKEAAARRELSAARQPAGVLTTRVPHPSRNPAPGRRAWSPGTTAGRANGTEDTAQERHGLDCHRPHSRLNMPPRARCFPTRRPPGRSGTGAVLTGA